ncbi:MAG: 2-oxoglutarate dehydrogenase E1 component [Planctomycetaceae bacterium]|nr:2-oxoglutarate dehydrogenase E1 component [Planctomycetaceae bacterium]
MSEDEPLKSGASPVDDGFDPTSLGFIEELYADYWRNPELLAPQWRHYFETLGGNGDGLFLPASDLRFPRRSLFHAAGGGSPAQAGAAAIDNAALQERVDRLVHAYRVRGHIASRIDPLNRPVPPTPELTPEFYGLSEADLDRPATIVTDHGPDVRKVRWIVQQMRNTYCRFIGVQFMHIDELSVRKWLQLRMEATENRLDLGRDEQLRILGRLTDAVIFEEFLQKKYRGSKSFSLEGGESLIPLLDLIIETAGDDGTREIVLGMAHRGRLNVLANIVGKRPQAIFREFEDADASQLAGRGDVKYHLGHSTQWTTSKGNVVHLSLCFNPSHLEFINPVALGRMRAKQDRFGDHERRRGLVLLIHGDAAFAGEGIVQETLNLSGLAGYQVGGTIHVIINNQLGFTTLPREGRSSPYASDVAKMLQSPIFHVNGEDPEAVAQVARLALDFRRKFQRDVVIDMYCYRRRGHSEGDEPSFTQPVMYRAIEERESVRENYLERLLLLGGVTVDEADQIADERRVRLEDELALARAPEPAAEAAPGVWAGYRGGTEDERDDVPTGVPENKLVELLLLQTQLPADFHAHPKIERWLDVRRNMAQGKRGLDWSAGEALALASLAVEGTRIRLTGQDSGRGTFSQRHAILYDTVDGHAYSPLNHLQPKQAPVEIIDSPLSEAAVLGFEYGFSLDTPDGLVVWEAQFGDFVNAAQVIIDQFIVSAEDKWSRLSGVVLLLPHGMEGQGPEHSSARLERFLSLAAEDNIQIVSPTTPAQYFHCLRRQVLRRWRKPLVVMTPKSLLRLPAAVSPIDDLTGGTFARVLPDVNAPNGRHIRRLLLCTGKIYYDLVQRREELKLRDVAILRLEQLYPLPMRSLETALAQYADGTPVVWVQEEPANMGAWPFLRLSWGDRLLSRFPFSGICRPASASPATGSSAAHKFEQRHVLDQAFEGV